MSIQNQLALIAQGLSIVGETTPPLFDPLGEGADEKEVEAFDASISVSGGGGTKKKGTGGTSKVMYTIEV